LYQTTSRIETANKFAKSEGMLTATPTSNNYSKNV
jgi:hypothetical protein